MPIVEVTSGKCCFTKGCSGFAAVKKSEQ